MSSPSAEINEPPQEGLPSAEINESPQEGSSNSPQVGLNNSPQEGSSNSPQVGLTNSPQGDETKVLSEDIYYNSQLKKVYNNWNDLQSLLNKYLIVFVTACITSVTIGIVFSISDENTMGSLSKKIISNQPDTVDDLNKEEQGIPWSHKDSNFNEDGLDKIANHEKNFREPLCFMKKLAKNTKTTLIFVAIWSIIFSCLIIYVTVYSIIIAASTASTASDDDDYRILIKWLFICPAISIVIALVYTYQINIVPNIVEKKNLHFKDKVPLSNLVEDENKKVCCRVTVKRIELNQKEMTAIELTLKGLTTTTLTVQN
ncbi:1298_t:CDS:2 [Dentiscutata erythropus]|uniref:1298_t:CDS:1 n=1 Tax=Dentiscutata erythropus TaxID=1348616 RepID=A0A9N9E2G0_9GLOM|nr:1298_t:CDS:2 [Dentiscutata erythropus]